MHRLSHSADEERHYTELALRMLEAVDVPTRVAVAKRFAHYQRPPLRVLQMARARSADGRLANCAAIPAAAGAGRRVAGQRPGRACQNRSLGEKQHAELPVESIDAGAATELNELFFTATTTERRLILLNMHVVDPNPTLRSRIVTGAAIGQELEGSVPTGKRVHFAARLAQALRISHEQARRIANDQLGEPVLVAAKTLALRRDVLYRISSLFVNPAVGHSVERAAIRLPLSTTRCRHRRPRPCSLFGRHCPQPSARISDHRTQSHDESRLRVTLPARRRNAIPPLRRETSCAASHNVREA